MACSYEGLRTEGTVLIECTCVPQRKVEFRHPARAKVAPPAHAYRGAANGSDMCTVACWRADGGGIMMPQQVQNSEMVTYSGCSSGEPRDHHSARERATSGTPIVQAYQPGVCRAEEYAQPIQ